MKIIGNSEPYSTHDRYTVTHCNWKDHPVISLNDEYTFYRYVTVRTFLHELVMLDILDEEDIIEWVDLLNKRRMLAVLEYGISESKSYLRFKHACTYSGNK